MTHQAVDLIDGDDARLLVNQAVTADGRQHLRVGECLQDRIALQFVEAEDARADPIPSAARQVDIGRAVEERRPWSRPGTQSGDLIGKVAGDGLHGGFLTEACQHIADRLTGRREVG